MCLSCGCKRADDNHGDDRNITAQTLEGAAAAGKISADQVLINIEEGARVVGPAGPRRVSNAAASASKNNGACMLDRFPRAVKLSGFWRHDRPRPIERH